MIDLGNRLPQRRQTGARTQGLSHFILHRGHFAFDLADFIRAVGRLMGSRSVFRVGLEADDALGQLPDRPDDKDRQADKDQETGEERDAETDPQHTAEAGLEIGLERFGPDDDLDFLPAAHLGLRHDMDQAVGLSHEGFPWRPQIEDVVPQIFVRLAQVEHLFRHPDP